MKIIIKQVSETSSESTIRGHHVVCDRPIEKEGSDKGPMGGEYLLMGLGGCFTSNLLAAIKSRKADVSGVQVEVNAVLEQHPTRFSEISLLVSATYTDQKLMEKLMAISERGCIVANSIKGSIKLGIALAIRA